MTGLLSVGVGRVAVVAVLSEGEGRGEKQGRSGEFESSSHRSLRFRQGGVRGSPAMQGEDATPEVEP